VRNSNTPSSMSDDQRSIEYISLIDGFSKSLSEYAIDHLCQLIELVRGEGRLYGDFSEKNAELLELILSTSFEVVRSPLIYTSLKHWWFLEEVYDTVFHQVRLAEYPAKCAELYFMLSCEVLDEKFHKFYNSDDKIDSYGMCVYFIQMADGWFASRDSEFKAIFKKMQPLFSSGPDHLEEPWLNRYKALKEKIE
jgi:hypothetical protein